MLSGKIFFVMTVTPKPDLEEELTARAQAEGLSTEEFVNRELEKLIASGPRQPKLTSEERARFGLNGRKSMPSMGHHFLTTP
jgi:hypothetical protein